jgi:hypothetical protein
MAEEYATPPLRVNWAAITPEGDRPTPRGGHTAVAVKAARLQPTSNDRIRVCDLMPLYFLHVGRRQPRRVWGARLRRRGHVCVLQRHALFRRREQDLASREVQRRAPSRAVHNAWSSVTSNSNACKNFSGSKSKRCGLNRARERSSRVKA